jgi:hypothetical protein
MKKKLVLRRNTVRVLDEKVNQVAGGIPPSLGICPTGNASCLSVCGTNVFTCPSFFTC